MILGLYTYAATAVVAGALAFGAGWKVQAWRYGKQIADIQAQHATAALKQSESARAFQFHVDGLAVEYVREPGGIVIARCLYIDDETFAVGKPDASGGADSVGHTAADAIVAIEPNRPAVPAGRHDKPVPIDLVLVGWLRSIEFQSEGLDAEWVTVESVNPAGDGFCQL